MTTPGYSHAHIKAFLQHNYRHFNAATVVDAAQGWVDHLGSGGKMFFTMAGAMSTAELGVSLAEMIRQDKIAAITCTGANLEEDVYNLVAHDHYQRVPHYRSLSTDDEVALFDKGYNRVTDTCIPEDHALRVIEGHMRELWSGAEKEGRRFFPHEYFFQLLLSGKLKKDYQIDPAHSWLLAAAEKGLPIFVPGWEDSTNGNMFVGAVMSGVLKGYSAVRVGLEYMQVLAEWYTEAQQKSHIGFFQIGGGIAGDFPICVVPMLVQDLERDVKKWSYFCQISDSTTSYGSYSGAVPNEKITWGKLEAKGPKFIIESDATIVAPLIFSYVLAS
ncbi:MAG: deoxyhypusine synthase [Deltaproteobacteria bacterium RBG_16_71_12]|nr:MAG: deoxyhypusine synthase [Deltaproteobacteria bacterium RBG_16_71_12]